MSDRTHPQVCAVTGTGGYLGGQVKGFFEARGWQVLKLTRQPAPGRAMPFRLGEDIAPATLAGVRALVHCAYDFTGVRWPEIHRTNVTGTEKLLRAAQAAGVPRIICISTISAFDGCRSLYGRAKLEIERAALEARALVLRPGLIYGDEPGAMVGRLVRQVSRASVALPLVGGSKTQYLVHVEDLCSFIHRFAEGTAPAPNHPLTVAAPQPWTMRSLLEAIAEARGSSVRLAPVPWRMVWLPLRLLEACGFRPAFRSDSLVSLMHQNPAPDFSGNERHGLRCRPFDPKRIRW